MHEFRARLRGEYVAPKLLAEKNRPGTAEEISLDGVAIRRAEVRRSNNRTETRQPVDGESVTIRLSGIDQTADLKNLSAGGAMVEGLKAKLFDRVELILGDTFEAQCEVKWLKGSRAGLEFCPGTKVDCSDEARRDLASELTASLFPAADTKQYRQPAPQKLGGGHRDSKRHNLVWTATLHHAFRSETVRIRNISGTGALIEFTGELASGATPVLEIAGARILDCQVVWRFGDQAGLKFQKGFNVALLGRTSPQVAGATNGSGAHGRYVNLDQLSIDQLQDELEGFLRH